MHWEKRMRIELRSYLTNKDLMWQPIKLQKYLKPWLQIQFMLLVILHINIIR